MIMPDGSIYSRTVSVYKCPEFNVFLVTGQLQNPDQVNDANPRKNHITILPFHTLTDEEMDFLSEKATEYNAYNRAASNITLSIAGSNLSAYDKLCRTNSTIPLADLDEEIKNRITQTRKTSAINSLRLS